MSISSILNIAKNSISANQMSLQVASHNISNVNTKGYNRQETVLDEETPLLSEGMFLGNGVKVSGVIGYYDKYLDQQISRRNTELAEQQVNQKYFERIEGILNEESTKLTQNITDFFNGWQELSTDPTSVATRQGIVAKGENLSRSIRNIYNGLKGLQIEQNINISQEISDINRITASIASLNDSIFEGSSNSSEAIDYLSKRTEYVKELSGKLNIISFSDKFGRITILGPTGKALVDGSNSWDLSAMRDETTGFSKVAWNDGSGNSFDITDGIGGGSIYGLINMRDEQIPDFIKGMDRLAEALIAEVNDVHKAGYSINHTQKTPDEPDDIPFFKEIVGDYSQGIDLSDEVKADLKNIAAASEADNVTGKPIGNGVALNMAALMDANLFDNGTSTLVNYTSSMTNKIGQLSKGAKDFAQYSQDTMAIMEKQRESVSGVSLDEEMANLMRYQYAFQASSRLFTVADDLFKTILEAFR